MEFVFPDILGVNSQIENNLKNESMYSFGTRRTLQECFLCQTYTLTLIIFRKCVRVYRRGGGFWNSSAAWTIRTRFRSHLASDLFICLRFSLLWTPLWSFLGPGRAPGFFVTVHDPLCGIYIRMGSGSLVALQRLFRRGLTLFVHLADARRVPNGMGSLENQVTKRDEKSPHNL